MTPEPETLSQAATCANRAFDAGVTGSGVTPAIEGVSLAEACDFGILPVRLPTAKTWRRRYKNFPEPIGYEGLSQLFAPEDLDEFARTRRGS